MTLSMTGLQVVQQRVETEGSKSLQEQIENHSSVVPVSKSLHSHDYEGLMNYGTTKLGGELTINFGGLADSFIFTF